MQPVNVLPTYVSQDTDSKTKETSSSSSEVRDDASFSRLIDQHVTDEKKTNNDKERHRSTESSTENDGKSVAAQVDKKTEEASSRQEDDANSPDASHEENNVKTEDNEALTESEQFIALLYNSDKTLANMTDKAKQDSTAIADKKANGTQELDKSTTKEVGEKTKEEKTSTSANEHKLSAFSKEELLARQQLRSNTLAQQPIDQVFKDYQKSLQSLSSTSTAKSISNEQLMSVQLSGNKLTDLAASVSQENKNTLTEKVDSGVYKLPVEHIVKGNVSSDEVSNSIKGSVDKEAVVQGNAKSALATEKGHVQLSNEQRGKGSTQASAESVKNQPTTATKEASSVELKPDAKNVAKIAAGSAPTKNVSPTDVAVDSDLKGKLIESPAQQKVTVPAANVNQAQSQVVANAQQAQSASGANSDQGAVDDAGEEFAYSDAVNSSQEKNNAPSIKSSTTLADNIVSRSASEVQAQTIQATQTKQSNDAYVDHQTSEALNHSVATDTAQIQKNNVQLHQETIAIFRKDFSDAVKDKVMVMINQKLQRFDITLDPPEFGNMQVRVNLQGEQASVNFVVQNQQAKEALEQNMHKLRDMLAEQGVDVGGANVEQQSQQQNNDESNVNSNGNQSSLASQDEEQDNIEHTLSATLFDSSATAVDYYA